MKDSTKQRVFWLVATAVIAACVIGLDLISIMNEEIETIYNGGPGKLIQVFLLIALGVSLFYLFDKVKGQFIIALFVGILFCIFDLREAPKASIIAGIAGTTVGILLAFAIKLVLWKYYRNNNCFGSKRVEAVLNALALFSVLQYCVYRFMQSTMFRIYYSDKYKVATLLLIIVLGGIRYVYLVLKNCWSCENYKDVSYYIIKCILAWLLAAPFFMVGIMHNYKALIYLPFCVMALYKMTPEFVLKWHTYVIGILFIATIMCSLAGTVQNITYAGYGGVHCAYGIVQTTDCASYVTFLLIGVWCGILSHKWVPCICFCVVTGILSYKFFVVTGSRTVLFSGILLIVLVIWNCIDEKTDQNTAGFLRVLKKIVDTLSIIAFPAVAVFCIITAFLYAQKNPVAIEWNSYFSNRLLDTCELFQRFGVHLFGSDIEKLHGFGATLIHNSWSSGYTYLDEAYALLAIRYGVVITLIVAGLWMWMTVKALKGNRKRIALAMGLIAIHGFFEARMIDVNYCIILIMPFCEFYKKRCLIGDKKLSVCNI